MIDLDVKTPNEVDREIAGRIRRLRKRRNLSQKRLSEKSGVSLGSVKRFEQSGEISLRSLTKIAMALRVDGELRDLFADVLPESIEEILNEED